MVILLPVTFILIYLVCYNSCRKWEAPVRNSFLIASIFWAVVLTCMTELFSVFRIISYPALSVGWLIVILVLIYLLLKQKFHRLVSPGRILLSDRFLLGGIFFIVIITAVMAYLVPPQNVDSMTYHLARVAHWAQNGTVGHYFTAIQRQLYQNPWAEFVILHLYVLSGESDKFANFVQWISMVGSLIGLTLIARSLGLSRKGQIVTAAVALSIPMGILQASSTQNDYVVSFWMITSIYYFLQWQRGGMQKKFIFVLGALSLSLALLSKAPAYIYCFPFAVWFLSECLWKLRAGALKYFFIFILCITAINSPHWIRNVRYFHNPISSGSDSYVNQRMNLKLFISNVVRNLSLHITPFNERQRREVERRIISLHEKMGVNITDPNTSYVSEFSVYRNFYGEDSVGNMLHFFTILILLLILPLMWKRCCNREFKCLLVCTIVSFVIFCLVLKWQPWHSRLHLFYFLILSPSIGYILQLFNRKWLLNLVGFIFLFSAIPPALFASTKKVVASPDNIFFTPRQELYFAVDSKKSAHYHEVADYILKSGCKQVGLMMGSSHWEYPFWFLTRGHAMRIEHVSLENVKKEYPLGTFSPCIIVDSDKKYSAEFTFERDSFIKVKNLAELSIYQKDETGILKKENQLVHFHQLLLELEKAPRPKADMDLQYATSMVNYLNKTLIDTKCFDFKELDKVYPHLGEILQKTLLVGLEARLMAYREQDLSKLQLGNQLIGEWISWFREHSMEIERNFVSYLSQVN